MMASKDKRLINTPWLCTESFSILHHILHQYFAVRIMVLLMCSGLTYKTIGGIYHIWNMQAVLHRFKYKIVTSFSGSSAAAELFWVNLTKWLKSSRLFKDEIAKLLTKTEPNKCKNIKKKNCWMSDLFFCKEKNICTYETVPRNR